MLARTTGPIWLKLNSDCDLNTRAHARTHRHERANAAPCAHRHRGADPHTDAHANTYGNPRAYSPAFADGNAHAFPGFER